MMVELVYVTEQQMARRWAEDKRLVARWNARQATLRVRDAKIRWFWIGFGVAFGLFVVALLVGVARH